MKQDSHNGMLRTEVSFAIRYTYTHSHMQQVQSQNCLCHFFSSACYFRKYLIVLVLESNKKRCKFLNSLTLHNLASFLLTLQNISHTNWKNTFIAKTKFCLTVKFSSGCEINVQKSERKERETAWSCLFSGAEMTGHLLRRNPFSNMGLTLH